MNRPGAIHTMQLNPDPEVIDLGVGQPQVALLPLDLLRVSAARRLGQDDPSLLQYGAEQGDGFFRLALARFLSQGYGLPVDMESLFITAGASQGLDLIATLLAASGDTVFVEEPSYFLALRILADHGLKVVGVPADADGIIPEALEAELERQQPRFLYTIPTFQNPTGATLTEARRARLAELSRAYDFTIVADEVYHLLHFDALPPPPLAAYLDRGNIVSLGSFSKILAPGLRLGWIQAAPALIDRLTHCGLLDSSGGLSPFTSGIVRIALEEGWVDRYLITLRATYRARAAAMSEALHREAGSAVQFQAPRGGYFFWCELNEALDAVALLPAAERRKVGYRPGVRFSSRDALHNYLRLSFAYYDIPALQEGVRRLARVVGNHQ